MVRILASRATELACGEGSVERHDLMGSPTTMIPLPFLLQYGFCSKAEYFARSILILYKSQLVNAQRMAN